MLRLLAAIGFPGIIAASLGMGATWFACNTLHKFRDRAQYRQAFRAGEDSGFDKGFQKASKACKDSGGDVVKPRRPWLPWRDAPPVEQPAWMMLLDIGVPVSDGLDEAMSEELPQNAEPDVMEDQLEEIDELEAGLSA